MITEVDRAKGPLETAPFRRLPESLGGSALGSARRGQLRSDGGVSGSRRHVDSACVHLELPWLLTEREVL